MLHIPPANTAAKPSAKQEAAVLKKSSLTSLVNYGSNLGSTVKTGRFTVNVKNSINLHIEPYSIIVGKLLSDG
jgi:hypothetical protein